MSAKRTARRVLTALGMLWAAPYTLVGLAIGAAGLCTGGHARRHGTVVEFTGGAVSWFVEHVLGETTLAFTLGHVILGRADAALDIARRHEMAHVRQYMPWGPLMGPAYLGCSLALRLAGRRPYWDNPFERQARREADA